MILVNTSCRTCAYCDWRNQYCGAHDMDMSPTFMRHNFNCKMYKRHEEEL